MSERSTALVITADRIVDEVTVDISKGGGLTFTQVASSVGKGCVVHRLDPEIAAASLLRGDGAQRNRHAEALVRGVGIQPVPQFFGTVALMGLDQQVPNLPVWECLCHLASFHYELIIDEHHRVLATF